MLTGIALILIGYFVEMPAAVSITLYVFGAIMTLLKLLNYVIAVIKAFIKALKDNDEGR